MSEDFEAPKDDLDKELTRVVTALRTIAPELPFEINCIELTQPEESFSIQGYDIHEIGRAHV